MADAVAAGKVSAIGVSNYSAAQLRIAHAALAERGIPLASNQVEYSLLHRAPEVNGVLDACTELGITLIAYQPLAQGVLTGKYRPRDRPKGLRRFGRYYRGDGLEKAKPVVALAASAGVPWTGRGATQAAPCPVQLTVRPGSAAALSGGWPPERAASRSA